MPACFALGQNFLLIAFRQSNIAMTTAMNVHEHGWPDKKGVFVDACILLLRNSGQAQDSLPQLLMNFFS
jgi:hypothetical protein